MTIVLEIENKRVSVFIDNITPMEEQALDHIGERSGIRARLAILLLRLVRIK